jgi:hypothetical protein
MLALGTFEGMVGGHAMTRLCPNCAAVMADTGMLCGACGTIAMPNAGDGAADGESTQPATGQISFPLPPLLPRWWWTILLGALLYFVALLAIDGALPERYDWGFWRKLSAIIIAVIITRFVWLRVAGDGDPMEAFRADAEGLKAKGRYILHGNAAYTPPPAPSAHGFCDHCGTAREGGARFCTGCGHRLED